MRLISYEIMQKTKRFPFTESENQVIKDLVKRIGEDWEAISKKLPGRTPKQCHDRYINYLREGLKNDPWSSQEDETLINMYNAIGPKWTKMMIHLPGRSGNDIKNRWHKHLMKKSIRSLKIKKNDNSKPNLGIPFDDQPYEIPSISKVHSKGIIKSMNTNIKGKKPIVRLSPKDLSLEVLPHFLGMNEPIISTKSQQQLIPLQQQIQEELQNMEFEMAFELEMSQI